jgi:predicted nucleic acid-binding Zn ribbon protein
MEEAMVKYYEHYKPKEIIAKEQRKRREKYVFGGIIIVIALLAYFLYKK